MTFPPRLPPYLVVALDFLDKKEALACARDLDPAFCRLKVGSSLFVGAGPGIVLALREMGFSVFLDLKFHDIPRTVASACEAAAKLGAWMVSVHAQGGQEMLLAARQALPPSVMLVAVTVLTSLDEVELGRLGVLGTPCEAVLRLAELSLECGADGWVASAQEVGILRERFGPSPLLVIPGMREKPSSDDQKRVGKVEEAAAGDYFVVGRPIIHAPAPGDEARRWAARISNIAAKKG